MWKCKTAVVLGANGTMGAAAGALLTGAGVPTTFLARSREKAAAGAARAERLLRTASVRAITRIGSYEELEREVAEADLVIEAVAEDYALKTSLFSRIDEVRPSDSVVATVSSGLSIARLCRGRSNGFSENFLGIHLFNPPTLITGCELIPHAASPASVVRKVDSFLRQTLRREVVIVRDSPAFCGNRIAFKVLNEIVQLSEEHGIHYLEAVLGPHGGRAMAPFATMDFVGLDVHQAIADNLFQNTADAARARFVVPGWLRALVTEGRLGLKTPERGGFYRTQGTGADARRFVYDPSRRDDVPVSEVKLGELEVVAQMRRLNRVGRYADAVRLLATAPGRDAELMRRVVLGYISYALGLVGEVVEHGRDIDRIMSFGFNWAPPSLWLDYLTPATTVTLLERARLAVPRVVVDAADQRRGVFRELNVDAGRFFAA
jgi:3-hydroxyacyl-CoA dehydrogenase